MIAQIAVASANFAIDKPYSYRVPRDMTLEPGLRVLVPFGRGNRKSEGVVLSLEEGSREGLKAVERVLDSQVLLSSGMLQMAAFLRERYFCTFYDAVRAMLPGGLWFQTRSSFRLTEDTSWKEKKLRQPDARKILDFLSDCGGETGREQLAELVPDGEALDAALAYLGNKKWITDEADYLRRIGDKTEKIAVLAVSSEEAMAYAHRSLRSPMQRAVLELMCSLGSVSVKELCYFTGARPATVKRLAELGYLELKDREVLRCSQIKPAKISGELTLNAQQQAAFSGLQAQLEAESPGVALLYGITGSGKTAVYLKLIRACLDSGKSAMLLVPEIALTPQLLSLLAAYFGQLIAVQHSSLSPGERYDQWRRIREGKARVVVGTRSAVFAPARELGLIILDEEQEHSYKSEQSPRYAAKEVAIWRGNKERALVLLGSATPSIETMYRARQGDYSLYTLKERYNGKSLPQVQLVDMKQEVREGNDLSVSRRLRDELWKAHEQGKQSILFLNRRGNSRYMLCVECGEAPECPRCSAKLTYHSANRRLMCHYCGYSEKQQERCTHCGGPMKCMGTGTQKVQQELQELFPELEIARMDSDTVTATNTHEKILDHFKNDRVPVLIGTQMVAKGLNLPDVTLVGVLDADQDLYSGSFRAAQNAFNMLTQVVGRAGRGDAPGQAVIQTMVPEHKVLALAARQDYDSFYEMELQMRRVQKYPPFGDIAAITFLGQEEGRVLRGAALLRDSLNACLKEKAYEGEICQVLGPAPCAVPKINYNYRYRLTLRCRMTRQLRGLIAHLLRQFSGDSSNRGVSAFADVNGFEE